MSKLPSHFTQLVELYPGVADAYRQLGEQARATAVEIRHAALQGVTTLGFPKMMRGMIWVDDVLVKHG